MGVVVRAHDGVGLAGVGHPVGEEQAWVCVCVGGGSCDGGGGRGVGRLCVSCRVKEVGSAGTIQLGGARAACLEPA